jgi:hypothetical protein
MGRSMNEDPKQLELFGLQKHISDSINQALSASLCKKIATLVGEFVQLNPEELNNLRSFALANCKERSHPSSHFNDYVRGLAMTMSFLPTPMQQTFWRSDRAALASDWQKVQNDVDKVSQAVLLIQKAAESLRDERKQNERRERVW